MTDETSAAVLEFMAADPAGTEFTTQQVAEFCLRDPFRAGELRDVIFPALAAADKVTVLPADDEHNATRYVLRVADPETEILGLSVDIREYGVTIQAGAAELYRWAHRPGCTWLCSVLASDECDGIRASFDAHGLVDLEVFGVDVPEVPADEFNAWSSDVLRDVLPADHPAYFVTVGQFD